MRSFDKPVAGTGSGLALAGPGARTQVHHHSAHSGDAATAGRAPRPARLAAAPPRNVTGFPWPLGDVSTCGTRTTSWEFPGEPRDAPLPTPQWAWTRQGSLGGAWLWPPALLSCSQQLARPPAPRTAPVSHGHWGGPSSSCSVQTQVLSISLGISLPWIPPGMGRSLTYKVTRPSL